MKKLFSSSKSPKLPAPPKGIFGIGNSSPSPSKSHSRSSSLSKRLTSLDSSPNIPQFAIPSGSELSPELVPIVTLLSAQSHRRYQKGVLLVFHDLKNDGTPADRKWQEYYAVLLGTQVALWDAKELAECDTNSGDKLKKLASKPNYINFSDASLRPLDSDDSVDTTNRDQDNILVVSTTLKNRYFIQFSDKKSFDEWTAALRLSLFEFTSLQEAYTGAFLSSRGSKLGDIKVILADKKFSYEDWVSVRFGAGMPWKRCFAVVNQIGKKKKDRDAGRIVFYENEKKNKKLVIAIVTDAKAAYAVYPSSPLLIDNSTIIKVEGSVTYSKEDETHETSIFIMPERHQGVPSYDTIIRFLIPTMNAFNLYGRPTQLIADRNDPNSLLFALPTLPYVYYLTIDDVLSMIESNETSYWNEDDWKEHIKEILVNKLENGYVGCGTKAKVSTIYSTPSIDPQELLKGSGVVTSSSFFNKSSIIDSSRQSLPSEIEIPTNKSLENDLPHSNKDMQGYYVGDNGDLREEAFSVGEQSPVLNEDDILLKKKILDPKSGKETIVFHRNESRVDMEEESNKGIMTSITDDSIKSSTKGDLSELYEKYSVNPFGNSRTQQTYEVEDDSDEPNPSNLMSPYENYIGSQSESKGFEISNFRDSTSTAQSEDENSFASAASDNLNDNVSIDEFNELAKKISEVGMGSANSINSDRTTRRETLGEISNITGDLKLELTHTGSTPQKIIFKEQESDNQEADVFNPDYMEQSQVLGAESIYTTHTEDQSTYSKVSPIDTEDNEDPSQKIPHSNGLNDLKDLVKTENTSTNIPDNLLSKQQPINKMPQSNTAVFNNSTQQQWRMNQRAHNGMPMPVGSMQPKGGISTRNVMPNGTMPVPIGTMPMSGIPMTGGQHKQQMSHQQGNSNQVYPLQGNQNLTHGHQSQQPRLQEGSHMQPYPQQRVQQVNQMQPHPHNVRTNQNGPQPPYNQTNFNRSNSPNGSPMSPHFPKRYQQQSQTFNGQSNNGMNMNKQFNNQKQGSVNMIYNQQHMAPQPFMNHHVSSPFKPRNGSNPNLNATLSKGNGMSSNKSQGFSQFMPPSTSTKNPYSN